jgi:hypothetical protein
MAPGFGDDGDRVEQPQRRIATYAGTMQPVALRAGPSIELR